MERRGGIDRSRDRTNHRAKTRDVRSRADDGRRDEAVHVGFCERHHREYGGAGGGEGGGLDEGGGGLCFLWWQKIFQHRVPREERRGIPRRFASRNDGSKKIFSNAIHPI